MKRFITPLLVVGIVMVVAVGMVWFVFPDWRTNPVGPGISGFTLVLGIFASVLSIIKSTIASKKVESSNPIPDKAQSATFSTEVDQLQKGKGFQSQKACFSKKVKQRQE